MEISKGKIQGLLEIKPKIHEDKRGFFYELYNYQQYKQNQIPTNFIQDNISFSKYGTLRGMHFQKEFPQVKLVICLHGEILDVAVDLRSDSNTFGSYETYVLSSKKKNLLLIPEGFAHGFFVLSKEAQIMYKCSNFYHPEDDYGFIWNDKDINIDWPQDKKIISEKDSSLPSFQEIIKEKLTF